jgi:hypothetical protein
MRPGFECRLQYEIPKGSKEHSEAARTWQAGLRLQGSLAKSSMYDRSRIASEQLVCKASPIVVIEQGILYGMD